MSWRIRPADPATDAVAMAAIYAPHVTDSAVSFELEAPSPATMAERVAAHRASGRLWLVAVDDNDCLGYAYAGAFRQRAAYDATAETSAYIAANAQGQGIGRALYRQLFAELVETGHRQAIAVITLPNPASARFHEQLGFHAAGRLEAVGVKFGRSWDVGLYQRPLTAADR
ncbi:GNAT family N-acetyltransferase [Salinisphaera sp. Q1T1-3]|uniref:GNAT family N-acetyltransferase n=1 Tax=Salinisphaera sp. Q1T1-3 TaxID=2321229 RepID=UPI000E770D39|nr:GNAT family N-acetyltransferase [Salinisphaera sp. Q1T1-3]RJS95228.1 N-acetyltransferase [Salinisphaera sp. Q1T1-3]